MKKLIITTIAILTILSCCKKDDINPEDYPFFCRVDGEIWRPGFSDWCPYSFPLIANYYPNGSILAPPGKFDIRATRAFKSEGIRQSIRLVVWGGLKEGNNVLSKPKIYSDYNGICGGYDLDTTYENKFIVNLLDTSNKKISGTLDLRAVSHDCTPPDTIKITEGYFDVNPTWHP